MKFLVTGATGFVGNHVIEYLLSKGHQIVAVSRNETKAKKETWYDKVVYKSFDLKKLDPNKNYFDELHQPDCLIHLAWSGLPNYKSITHIEDNIIESYSFIKNLITNGLSQVVVTGTCFEYGMINGCLAEEMTITPANPYAIAKDSLRKFLLELQKHQPFTFQWTRLFYMYGPGQNPKSLIPLLDKALEQNDPIFKMSGGEQLRDFLPVELVAEYIGLIALQKETEGIINCCSGKPISVRKLVEDRITTKNKSIKLELGFYPYPDYEPFAFWGNNNKLYKIIEKSLAN